MDAPDAPDSLDESYEPVLGFVGRGRTILMGARLKL